MTADYPPILQGYQRPTGKDCRSSSDCGSGHCLARQCYSDGHFVVFRHPTAIRQYTRFLATSVRDGLPLIAH